MTKHNTQKGKRTRTAVKKMKKESWNFPLTKKNFYYLAVGLGVIILGYILMATGITDGPALPDGKWNNPMAVTIAPILLFIGYVLLIPWGIFKYFGNKTDTNQNSKD